MRQNYLTVNFLVAISCFLFCTLFDQASEGQVKDMNSFNTFNDWCENKSKLDKEINNTIEQLLLKAKTSDCELADKRLNESSSLNLDKKGISSILPLKSFQNLVKLSLFENQINDLTPLKSLTKARISLFGQQQDY